MAGRGSERVFVRPEAGLVGYVRRIWPVLEHAVCQLPADWTVASQGWRSGASQRWAKMANGALSEGDDQRQQSECSRMAGNCGYWRAMARKTTIMASKTPTLSSWSVQFFYVICLLAIL